MYKSLSVVVGAIFGVVLVATCGGKMGGAGDAGAQSGPARMLTADTDVNQLAVGMFVLTPGSYQKVLDGPFMLTDAGGDGSVYPLYLYALPIGQDCTQISLSAIEALDGTNGRLLPGIGPSGRVFVQSKEQLCVALGLLGTGSQSRFNWGGFRPY